MQTLKERFPLNTFQVTSHNWITFLYSALDDHPGKILVVDDIKDNIYLLMAILESEGHTVETALSGLECLHKVADSAPELLLLDWMMPGMCGEEVVASIRSDSHLPYFPILIVTAWELAHRDILAMGANGKISKPIDLDELLQQVQAHLSLNKRAA